MNITASIKPIDVLNNCIVINPSDNEYTAHPIINKYGNPNQPIYIDQSTVTANGISYDSPLILPIYNARLELIQCGIVQDGQPIGIYPDGGLAKGFTCYGVMEHDRPVIVVYSLEAFFKIAQTGYAVVLVMLANVRYAHESNLKDFEFKQIEFVINQLSKAGYQQLYMPVRPELMATFQPLTDTPIKLINQSFDYNESHFFVELTQDEDNEDVKIFLDESIARLTHADQWGDILPLSQHDNSQALNPYPIHVLPPLARHAVQAIAEYVQAPIAMTAQCVIGAMSHIAQTYVNAPHPFNEQGEPCSLYLLTEGQSGSRKSTSRAIADKAIIQHERKQYEQYRADLEQWKSGQASLNKKDKEAYCAENPPPQDPSTLYSDITLESIAGLYVDAILKNASISSDEAGQFFGGHTMKSDTRTQAIGGYAKLFDDGFIERTRSKSNLNGSGRAYDVRLTFNLQGQHEVLSDALKDPILRGQGFLPRFILTIPENLAGTRLQDAIYQSKIASTDHRLIAYWTRCTYLLDDCPQIRTDKPLYNGRYVIPMNEEARQIDLAFYNLFEELQGKGKRYEYLQAFASRASQLARRLATVFAYFEGLQWIDGKTLTGACEIVKHSLNEWAMYADVEPKKESDAERLIKWLVKKCIEQKTANISKTLAMKGAPSNLRKANAFDPCINELIELNYIRLITINKTTYIELNPFLIQ